MGRTLLTIWVVTIAVQLFAAVLLLSMSLGNVYGLGNIVTTGEQLVHELGNQQQRFQAQGQPEASAVVGRLRPVINASNDAHRRLIDLLRELGIVLAVCTIAQLGVLATLWRRRARS